MMSSNNNSLFLPSNNNFNYTETSEEELQNFAKSLNIIDPTQLSSEELSNIYKRIDSYQGLFTTQQVESVDYNKFNQHVFFDSAVSKVSYSFDRIQNFPYDLDELENIKFNNKTDGYTDYIAKKVYPKSLGYVSFLGNEMVVVYDEQGKIINSESTEKNRKIGILNPENRRFSFDFWINPHSSNFVDSQIVFSKINIATVNNENIIDNGYLCFIQENSNDASTCYLCFAVYIDKSWKESKTLFEKDKFQHVNISVGASKGEKTIDFVIDGNFIDKNNVLSQNSLQNKSFNENFKSKDIPFVIGSTFIITELGVLNTIRHDGEVLRNLNADIDEFRVFHKIRSYKTIKKEMHKNIFSQKDLKLYLRFNEPAGNYNNSFLCIDYSGNKLHGILYNIRNNIELLQDTTNCKINSGTPLNLEKIEESQVLNSSYPEIKVIRDRLIGIAKEFDSNNPNLIFNLMPKHYFLESSDFQNLPVYSNVSSYEEIEELSVNENGEIISRSSLKAVIPANNELVNVVLIWARFFDQLKVYISSITNLLNVDYDSINNNKVIGMQIPLLCKMYGIKFSEIFSSITKNKLNSENLLYEDVISDLSIRKIQNALWQRFLINTQDFLRSKGTVRSIESTFNSFGIDYTKLVEIKEQSSNNTIDFKNNYKFETIKKFFADFGNKQNLASDAVFADVLIDNFSENKLFLEIPSIKTKTNSQKNKSDSISNFIGTNWSFEMFFDFNEVINNIKFLNLQKENQIIESNIKFSNKQYLFRLDNEQNVNVVSVKYQRKNNFHSNLGTLLIEIRTVDGETKYNNTLVIDDVDIFSQNYYLCLKQGKQGSIITHTAVLKEIGDQIKIKKYHVVEKAIDIEQTLEDNIFSNSSSLSLRIGDYNYTNVLNTIEDNGLFQGRVCKIRLWKKDLSVSEYLSHSKNIDNIGTEDLDPHESLVFDFEVKNILSEYDTNLQVYSWNIEDTARNKDLTGDNINQCTLKSKNQITENSIISFKNLIVKSQNSKFDESNTQNKVKIISYEKPVNRTVTQNFNAYPSYNVPYDFNYENINRVSIDMSIVKVINDDISHIISNMNDFVSKVSNYNSKYEYQYKELEAIRKRYFEKYKEDDIINYFSLINVFKYFDNIMSSVLYDIVPSRVKFEGFNFVYESHILERHKYQNKNKDSINTIVDENDVNFSRNSINSRRSLQYNKNRRQI